MEVTYRNVKELHLFLTDDPEAEDEITPFISSLNKIKKEVTKSGFRNMFSKDEKRIWLRVFENIIIQEKEEKPTDTK